MSRILVAAADPQGPHLPVQVAALETQELGGFHHVPPRLLEPAQDELPLEVLAPFPQGRGAAEQVGERGGILPHQPLDIREEGDLTIEYGRYTLGLQPPGAEPASDAGKYLIVHETQDDGSTKILYDVFNSNQPPGA